MKKILILNILLLTACASNSVSELKIAPEKLDSQDLPKITEDLLDNNTSDLWERIRVNLTLKIPEDYKEAEIYRSRFRNR